MSSPTSELTPSTAKTTPIKYDPETPSFKPAAAINQNLTAQGEILTASKTWSNAAYQENQQRQRQLKLAHHKRTTSQQQMARQMVDSREFRLNQTWMEFPSSEVLPKTLQERLEDEKALANMQQARLDRQRKEIEGKIAAQKLSKVSYGYKLSKPFGEKLLTGMTGAVLNQSTIWRAHDLAQIDITLIEWPSPAEFSYEGWERKATPKENFGRRLPIVRNWTEEFMPPPTDANRRLLDEKDVRPWERFMALQPYEFDKLHDHRPSEHVDLFPFGEGCTILYCTICRGHRAAWGLNDRSRYEDEVLMYKLDVSAVQMEECIPQSLLAALDDPDL